LLRDGQTNLRKCQVITITLCDVLRSKNFQNL
jgi:hypothetical protein